MVYCQKCGTKNEEDAEYCSNCGADLQANKPRRRRRMDDRPREECFGLPYGGAIVGIIVGIFLILIGLSAFYPNIVIRPYIWAIVLVIIGVLIIAGAIYRTTRRP